MEPLLFERENENAVKGAGIPRCMKREPGCVHTPYSGQRVGDMVTAHTAPEPAPAALWGSDAHRRAQYWDKLI